MLSSVLEPAIDTYRVEVSGWDSSYTFFVEKSELEWDEVLGKQVRLRRALSNGAMIFVRLMEPTAADCSSPVAYRAECLGPAPGAAHKFSLKQIHPSM
jgi:hypothetical protein